LVLVFGIYCRKKVNKNFFKSVKFCSFFEKIGKKHDFLLVFFLTPLFFRPKTDKLPKKFCQTSQLPKIMTKKIYRTLWSKFTAEFKKIRPPPYRPYRGGVVFEILHFQTFLLSMKKQMTHLYLSWSFCNLILWVSYLSNEYFVFFWKCWVKLIHQTRPPPSQRTTTFFNYQNPGGILIFFWGGGGEGVFFENFPKDFTAEN
jgi:hypothetical protein